MLKKYVSTEANYLQIPSTNIKHEILYLHDMLEDSSIVSGE